MSRTSTKWKATDYSALIEYHASRMDKLTRDQVATAFFHFVGAVEGMCAPKSPTNHGPTRERLLRALERAVNSQTGT